MIRAARLLVGLSVVGLTGCQLVVGDIELPTLIQRTDASADAEAYDAAVYDAGAEMAMPPPDAGIIDATRPDLAWPDDLGVDLAVDLGVDAWLPAAGPTDLTTLAGTWHLYGARGRQRNLTLFTAALNIDGSGAATLTEIGSMVPLSDVETLFDVHPDGTARVSINLFPRAGRLAGMMDPVAGAATFVNDVDFGDTTPTFIVAARVNALNQLPPELIYLDLQVEPLPGVGEGGRLERGEMGRTYTQVGRLGFDEMSVAALAERTLDAVYSNRQRVVLTEGEAPAEGFALSPAAGGYGAAGVFGPQDDPSRLVFAWSAIQAPLFLPARYWCAGHGLDADGRHRSLSAFASLGADGRILWDNGGAAILEDDGAVFALDAPQNFFGNRNGMLTMDPDQRVLMLIDYYAPEFRWGMGVCINLTPADP